MCPGSVTSIRSRKLDIQDFLNLVPNAIIVVDQQSRIVFTNEFAAALFDWPLDALEAQQIEALIPERYQ